MLSLRAALVLVLAGSALAKPGPQLPKAKPDLQVWQSPPEPTVAGQVVFRGDIRPPSVVREQGGFLPTGYNDGVTGDFSLYRHTCMNDNGEEQHYSQYVPTTSDRERALLFAASKLKKAPQTAIGYVYYIRPTSNFIDVNEALGEYSPFATEMELAALGGIRWDQVLGHAIVSRNPAVDVEFVPNPDYRHVFDNGASSPGQPQLAGFPPKHEALEKQPWAAFTGVSLYDSALDFMDQTMRQWQWRGLFPLFPDAREAQAQAKNVLRRASNANKHLHEAIKAKTPRQAEREAAHAAHEAKQAHVSALEVMEVYEYHHYLDMKLVHRVRSYLLWARKASMMAAWQAGIKLCQAYEKGARRLRELASKPIASGDFNSESLRRNVEGQILGIAIVKSKLEAEHKEKTARIGQLQKVLGPGSEVPEWFVEVQVWVHSRENILDAVRYELEGLQRDVEVLESVSSEVESSAARASGDALAIETEMKDEADQRKREAATASIFTDMALDIAAEMPTPFTPELQILAWGRRAWRMIKVIGIMVAKDLEVTSSHAAQKLKDAKYNLEQRLDAHKFKDPEPPNLDKKRESLLDLLRELDKPGPAGDTKAQKLDDLVRAAEDLQVPTQLSVEELPPPDTDLEEVLRQLDELQFPDLEAAAPLASTGVLGAATGAIDETAAESPLLEAAVLDARGEPGRKTARVNPLEAGEYFDVVLENLERMVRNGTARESPLAALFSVYDVVARNRTSRKLPDGTRVVLSGL